MSLQILYNTAAVENLRDIYDYVAADNLQAAETLIKELSESVHLLADFPQMGIPLSRKLRYAHVKNVMYLVKNGYYIFYESSETVLTIINVIHTKRDFMEILRF